MCFIMSFCLSYYSNNGAKGKLAVALITAPCYNVDTSKTISPQRKQKTKVERKGAKSANVYSKADLSKKNTEIGIKYEDKKLNGATD